MIKPQVTVSSPKPKIDLGQILKDLKKKQVYVGVPEETASRPKEGINNAALVFIHTHGSPIRHIPARPIIEPAIEATGNKEPIAKELGIALKECLDGNQVMAEASLEKTGMRAQNIVRAWFDDPRNGWAPNSPTTIKRKKSDKPLIDTAEMRKAITYVVKND